MLYVLCQVVCETDQKLCPVAQLVTTRVSRQLRKSKPHFVLLDFGPEHPTVRTRRQAGRVRECSRRADAAFITGGLVASGKSDRSSQGRPLSVCDWPSL